MKQTIKTLEGAIHQLVIKNTGNIDFRDYSFYGSCVNGCKCIHFDIVEKTENECLVSIPALKYGIYKYQLFAKEISTCKEYLLIEGQIIAEDRLCDCSNGSVKDNATTVIDTIISADNVEVSVSIEKGAKGDKGDKGDAGVVDYSVLEPLATKVEVQETKVELTNYIDAQMATVENTVQQVVTQGTPDNEKAAEAYFGVDLSSFDDYVVLNDAGGVAAYGSKNGDIRPDFDNSYFFNNNTMEVIDFGGLPLNFISISEGNYPTCSVLKNFDLLYYYNSFSFTLPNLTTFQQIGKPDNTLDFTDVLQNRISLALSDCQKLEKVTIIHENQIKEVQFGGCKELKEIDLDFTGVEIIDLHNTKISSIEGDLSNLKSLNLGYTQITSFDKELPNLQYVAYGFNYCDKLTSVTLDLSNATEMRCAFMDCNNLKELFVKGVSQELYLGSSCLSSNSLDYHLSNLKDNSRNTSKLPETIGVQVEAFGNKELHEKFGFDCENKTFTINGTGEWEITIRPYAIGDCSEGDLSSLVTGDNLFRENRLTLWNIDLPNLTNGIMMFYGCAKLTSFSADLSSLTNGNSMFSATNLTSFSADLSSLVNGNSMFHGSKLTSWNIDLSSLTDGYSMFHDCSNLTSFSGDLSSLTNGEHMFNGCSNLTSFSGDLSSLTNGNYMFYGCKLDAESVERILTTIPTITSSRYLYLGISRSAVAKLKEITGQTNAPNYNYFSYYCHYKGWNLYVHAR